MVVSFIFFFKFSSRKVGEDEPNLTIIFFRWVGKNPPTRFCASKNVNVSFSCVATWSEISEEVAKSSDYVCRGKGMKLGLSSLSEAPFVELYGSGAGCNWELSEDGLALSYFLFGSNTVPLSLQSGPITGSCDEDMKASSLVLYSEFDLWNPFINQAQAMMAFASIAALDLDPRSLRLLLLDLGPDSDGRRPALATLLEGLFSQGGLAVRRGEKPQLICADRLILPNGGHQSFIRKNVEEEHDPFAAKCQNAPIVRGYAAFLKESFTVTSKLVQDAWRITLLPRHPSETHPVPFTREMENSENVAKGLMNETSLSSFSDRSYTESLISALTEAGAIVQELQLETLSVSEQIDAIANTDLLISPHSAALSWMLVMPLCAQVLEIYAHGQFQFPHYASLAGVEHHFVTNVATSWGTKKFTLDVQLIVQEALAARGRRDKCLKNNKL